MSLRAWCVDWKDEHGDVQWCALRGTSRKALDSLKGQCRMVVTACGAWLRKSPGVIPSARSCVPTCANCRRRVARRKARGPRK